MNDNPQSVKGFLGISLFVGYLVAYPTRYGSTLRMRVGQIAEVGYRKPEFPFKPDGPALPYAKVRTLERYTYRDQEKLGRLTHMDAVTVARMVPLAWDDIPLHIARLFDPTYGNPDG